MARKLKKTKRKKRAKPSPEEIEKRLHRNEIRGTFLRLGFVRVSGISDKEIEFEGRKGDFDDVFIYDNVIVLAEYTTTQSSGMSKHLLPKKVLFDHIIKNKPKFISYLLEKFQTFKDQLDDYYDPEHCQVSIIYCSKNSIDSTLKDQFSHVIFFDYYIVKYFRSISNSIRLSARFELFSFLGYDYKQISKGVYTGPTKTSTTVSGTVLPETHSKFKKGFKVVSFYIDPSSLLQKSYVLRRHGWKDDAGVYQRMIIKNKIKSIRNYLNKEERVFINNIIVTLPSDTKIVDEDNNTVNPSDLKETKPVRIQIPDGYNLIGLIDGQHRVYAYHEGGEYEEKISKLREKQNLLVTGIIYPDGIKESDRIKFEATLFLEINSNQSNAKSDLKQAINVILNPFSSESIARSVIHKLNSQGALEHVFEEYFFEKGKIKTTSIVSYGLKPLVKLSGTDSFFKLWRHPNKEDLVKSQDQQLLNEYIKFCTSELNKYFGAIKSFLQPTSKWTADNKVKDKVLSTTAINGFIICFRHLIENRKTKKTFEEYRASFSGLDTFSFAKFKSSNYGSLAEELYKKFF